MAVGYERWLHGVLVEITSGVSAVSFGVLYEPVVPVFPEEDVEEVVPVFDELVLEEVVAAAVDEPVLEDVEAVPVDEPVLEDVVAAVEVVPDFELPVEDAEVFPLEFEPLPVFVLATVSWYSSGRGAPVYPQKFPFWSRFKSVFERSI